MWSFGKVLDALHNVEEYSSYYVGRTLFIDFNYGPSVLLNLNGRGQFYSFPDDREAVSFLMTKNMQRVVNHPYKVYKEVGNNA